MFLSTYHDLNFLGSVLQYARDCLTTIVFTSIEFNICLMYDILNGLHSVWKIRKPTTEVNKIDISS